MILKRICDIHLCNDFENKWNDKLQDLKQTILNYVSEPINQRIVVPGSGLTGNNAEDGRNMSHSINMFKNGTGVLRQVFSI